MDAPTHLVSVNDDQTTVLAGATRGASFSDLGEDGLAGARRLILERHASNIQRTGPCVKMSDRQLQSQRTDSFVDPWNPVQ